MVAVWVDVRRDERVRAKSIFLNSLSPTPQLLLVHILDPYISITNTYVRTFCECIFYYACCIAFIIPPIIIHPPPPKACMHSWDFHRFYFYVYISILVSNNLTLLSLSTQPAFSLIIVTFSHFSPFIIHKLVDEIYSLVCWQFTTTGLHYYPHSLDFSTNSYLSSLSHPSSIHTKHKPFTFFFLIVSVK